MTSLDAPFGYLLFSEPVYGTDESAIGQSPRNVYDMAPYEQYVADDAFGLYGMRGEGESRSWERDDIDPKTIVVGVEHGSEAVGYPITKVESAGGLITDTVGGLGIVVVLADGELRIFENPGLDFEPRDGEFYADGTAWDGVTGEGDDGRRLGRLQARRLFAFAWQDAHGADTF